MLGRFFSKRAVEANEFSTAHLAVEPRAQTVNFVVKQGAANVPTQRWFFHNHVLPEEVYATRVLALRQFQAEGLVSVYEDHVALNVEDLYELGPDELMALEIAPLFPYRCQIGCESEFARADFRCSVAYFDAAGQRVRDLQRLGCVFRQGQSDWLIPPWLFRLFGELESLNQAPTREERLIHFAEVRHLVEAGGGEFQGEYLRSREVIVADSVQVDLVEAGNGDLELVPRLGTEFDQAFLRSFRRSPQAKRDYDISRQKGRRVTVVLRDDSHLALKQIKHCGRMRGPAKEAFLAAPRRFLSSPAVRGDSLFHQAVSLRKPSFHGYVKTATKDAPITISLETANFQQPHDSQPKDVTLSREQARQLLARVKEARHNQQDQVAVDEGVALTELWALERQLHDTLAPAPAAREEESAPVRQLPATLTPGLTLLPHQLECLDWLQGLLRDDAPGCLLADDMGLGKTLQILTFFEWSRLSGSSEGPSLLVAPIGLLENWKLEYLKFFAGPGALCEKDLLPLFGKNLELMSPSGQLDTAAVARHPMVMTSYETLRSRATEFSSIEWSLVVLDEAQKIKNAKTQVSQAVKGLDSVFRIASTGTPVENSLSDLWSLMDFVSPGRLGGEREFLKSYSPERDIDYELLANRIEEQLGDRYLRRTKKDILRDLPPKVEHFPEALMNGLQHAQYTGVTAAASDLHPLEALLRLRQISCAVEGCSTQAQDYSGLSCKLHWLLELLSGIQQKGEKVLVFVEYKDVQRLVAGAVERTFRIPVHMINGDVSTMATRKKKSRGELIEEFQRSDGFGVLVLSPLAAGFGLTITEANHVVHFLRHWNPAKEDQATDRAYRIGQKRPVHVYYPASIVRGTTSFDQRLGELLAAKRKLASSAIFPSLYGKVEMEELFDVLHGGSEAPTARVTVTDLEKVPSHLFVGAVASLVRSKGCQVHRLELPDADLLVRSENGPSRLVRISQECGAPMDPIWASTTFQRFCSTKLETLEVFLSSGSRRPEHCWDRERLQTLLAETPLYWQDVYQKVPLFEWPSLERQAEGVERRLSRLWARRFHSAFVAPMDAEAEEAHPEEDQALFSEARFVTTSDFELAIEVGPLKQLPKFARSLRLKNGGFSTTVSSAGARMSVTHLRVLPIEGTYRFTAPGFEEDLDEYLLDLDLHLSAQRPSVFKLDRLGLGRPVRRTSLLEGSCYHLLLPPDYGGIPVVPGVIRHQAGDWTLDVVDIRGEFSPELAIYLARMGLSLVAPQSRFELVGPQLGNPSCPEVLGGALIARVSTSGEALVSICDGQATVQLDLEDGCDQFVSVDDLVSGGYVISLTPISTAQGIQTLGFEKSALLLSPPSDSWEVSCEGQSVTDGALLAPDTLSSVEITAPLGWPLRIVACLAGVTRIWSGEWQHPLSLDTVLGEIAVHREQREDLEFVRIDFRNVESVELKVVGPPTVDNLRKRVKAALRSYQGMAYHGNLDATAAAEHLVLPLLALLGHTPNMVHATGAEVCADLGPRRQVLIVSSHLDPSGAEARESVRILQESTPQNPTIVSNGLFWSLHGRFVKSPVNLEEALRNEADFEDFLAAFAAEELA